MILKQDFYKNSLILIESFFALSFTHYLVYKEGLNYVKIF